MPPKERKNRFKNKCLECSPNVEMDFDYKSKHNANFHNELLKKRKHIRFEMVGAPKNPFEAAARKKVRDTEKRDEGSNQDKKEEKEQSLADPDRDNEPDSRSPTKKRCIAADTCILTKKRTRIEGDKVQHNVEFSATIGIPISSEDDRTSSQPRVTSKVSLL